MKLAGAIWLTLFAITLTFVMGVVVWAFAGPTMATVIFVAAILLFVVLPARARR